MEGKKISKSVLKRLPGYLAYLKSLPDSAPPNISATALAGALGFRCGRIWPWFPMEAAPKLDTSGRA